MRFFPLAALAVLAAALPAGAIAQGAEAGLAPRTISTKGEALVQVVPDHVVVAESDIQTDVLNVELAYRDAGHPSRGIEGYYVRRAYSVTLVT